MNVFINTNRKFVNVLFLHFEINFVIFYGYFFLFLVQYLKSVSYLSALIIVFIFTFIFLTNYFKSFSQILKNKKPVLCTLFDSHFSLVE